MKAFFDSAIGALREKVADSAAQLLVITGELVGTVTWSRARSRRRRLQPVPHLSRGCNTVWQLDREG